MSCKDTQFCKNLTSKNVVYTSKNGLQSNDLKFTVYFPQMFTVSNNFG